MKWLLRNPSTESIEACAEEGSELASNSVSDPHLEVVHSLDEGVFQTGNGAFQAPEAQVQALSILPVS